ncbi:MAG: class I adenylate-forming enzyme family protein [Pseudomonadota bacterium]
MTSLSDIILRGAESFPEREAVSDANTVLTYGELAERALKVAGWLTQQGVAPGERIMIVLPNGVDFVAAHFGVLFAGAVSVPCDSAASPATLAAIRQSCRPAAMLDADTITDALAHRQSASDAGSGSGSDLAAILYTTGTTGDAKGVMLTHDNTLAALCNISEFVGYTQADREVVILPLNHSFGLGHVYCNLLNGGAVYLEPGMTRVGRILRKIEEWGATGFPGTPLGVKLLLDRYGPVFAERCAGLRFMVVNSAPLPPEDAARLQEHLPQCDIMVYYGLTEASRSTFASLTQLGPDFYRSVGKPMPGVDLRLSQAGEVLLSGPTVTPGYWGNPELTAEKIVEGYLHTGDLGRLDEAGNLFVTGRIGDMINFGGYKVMPSEVEAALQSHPAVDEVCVFGEELVEAAIVAVSGFEEQELARHCHALLEPYKVPARFHQVASIPRSNTGKVRRFELAQAVKELADAPA